MARRKQRNELVAGTFIVLAGLLIVVVLLTLANWRALFEGHKQVRLIFANQSIKDLKAGSEVKLRGVAVGSVEKVTLDYKAPQIIEVTVKVPAKLGLYANAPLSIGTTALGGSPWIEIEDIGSDSGFVVPPGGRLNFPTPAYLTTQPDSRHPLAKAAVPLADLDHPIYGSEAPNQLVKDLSKEMGFGNEQRTQFQEIIAALNEAATKVNDAAGVVSDMLYQAQSSMIPKLDKSLGNVQEITGGGIRLMNALNTRIPPVLDRISSASTQIDTLVKEQAPVIADTLQKINSTAGTLDAGSKDMVAKAQKSMDNIEQFTGTARDVMAANRDTLNDTLANLREGSGQMAAGLAEIRREPWRLLHTPGPLEINASNLLDAARAYAEGASNVRDALTRLADLAALHPGTLKASDPEYQNLLRELNDSREKFDKAERALYDRLNVK